MSGLPLNQIIHGNCLEVMGQFPDKSIDMILCDLPYGTTACEWDTVIPFEPLWECYNRIIKDNGVIALFAVEKFDVQLINSNHKYYKYELIWEKNVPTGMSYAKYRPMRYHEKILIFGKGKGTYNPIPKERVGVGKACYNYDHYCGDSNHIKMKKVKKKYDPDFVNPSTILKFNVVPNRSGKLHSTQKPVDLCEYLISTYSNEGDIILDNCMGSGTTVIACINTGRNFIGIEIEEKYVKIARERIEKHKKLDERRLFPISELETGKLQYKGLFEPEDESYGEG